VQGSGPLHFSAHAAMKSTRSLRGVCN
jgi:hypothetical protein